MTRLAAAAAALLHFATWRPSSAAPQPYPTLGPGDYSGPPTPASRDPLVRYRWDVGADAGRLQIFASPPASAAAAPPGAATGLRTLITSPYGEGAAIVVGPASVMLDFGLELPAWLEVAVPGGVPPGVDVRLGISEYDAHRAASVGPPTAAPVAYDGGTTLRLETTPLLFDGLRYAWLDVGCAAPPCAPLAVSGVRAVAQVLPLNYTGAFASDDATLDAIWYTGAYSTRVNAQPGFLGSELLSRGDRAPPFQGDAHVAQAAGLAAFGSPPLYALAAAMLNVTDSAAHAVHDSNIATYPLLWVLSVADFYVATGDARVFAAFAADAAAILDAALANFNTTLPVDLRWSGWDSRLGSGFSNVNQTPEARRYYRMTTLRASAGFAAACRAAGGAFDRYAVAFDAAVTAAAARLRAAGGPQWYVTGRYGLHAMAAAINGGWTTADERAGAFHLFNDSARVCSLSNFDSGFILNAFGVMGRVDFGLAMVRVAVDVGRRPHHEPLHSTLHPAATHPPHAPAAAAAVLGLHSLRRRHVLVGVDTARGHADDPQRELGRAAWGHGRPARRVDVGVPRVGLRADGVASALRPRRRAAAPRLRVVLVRAWGGGPGGRAVDPSRLRGRSDARRPRHRQR